MISLLSDGAETLSQWHHSTQHSNRHDKYLINVSYVNTLSKHRPITSQSPQEQTWRAPSTWRLMVTISLCHLKKTQSSHHVSESTSTEPSHTHALLLPLTGLVQVSPPENLSPSQPLSPVSVSSKPSLTWLPPLTSWAECQWFQASPHPPKFIPLHANMTKSQTPHVIIQNHSEASTILSQQPGPSPMEDLVWSQRLGFHLPMPGPHCPSPSLCPNLTYPTKFCPDSTSSIRPPHTS